MNSSEYKYYHESFMQNNHGSTAFHTFLCIFFTLQCTMLCAIRQKHPSYCVQEYLIIILTMIIAHTVLSNYIYQLNAAACFVLVFEIIKKYNSLCINKVLQSKNVFENGKIQTITCLRGLTYLITGLCILAVDFVDFPRQLAKTETYGYSLMDTGVGLFVLMSGLVHKNINKNNYTRIVKGNTKFILVLLLLGVTRFFTIKQLDYQEHVSEYGVHWNFFFTLAICKLLSCFLLIITNKTLLLSIFVLILHEILLYNGLQTWVFSKNLRIGFIDANREGVTSILGYVALYLYAANFKENVSNNTISRYSFLKKLLFKFSILYVISNVTNIYLPASRKLANAGYCTFLCTVLNFSMIFLYLIEVIFSQKIKIICYRVPFILRIINNNGLIYFLICNLSTGSVNLCFRTLLLPSFTVFIILNCYMIFTLSATIYFDKKINKTK